jgi:hypothetical protein
MVHGIRQQPVAVAWPSWSMLQGKEASSSPVRPQRTRNLLSSASPSRLHSTVSSTLEPWFFLDVASPSDRFRCRLDCSRSLRLTAWKVPKAGNSLKETLAASAARDKHFHVPALLPDSFDSSSAAGTLVKIGRKYYNKEFLWSPREKKPQGLVQMCACRMARPDQRQDWMQRVNWRVGSRVKECSRQFSLCAPQFAPPVQQLLLLVYMFSFSALCLDRDASSDSIRSPPAPAGSVRCPGPGRFGFLRFINRRCLCPVGSMHCARRLISFLAASS